MSVRDYRKLYLMQDKLLLALKPYLSSFYLTGGTALGRFYLNHRYSEDLDFFMNKDDSFAARVQEIGKELSGKFSVLRKQSVIYDDFARYYVEDQDRILKVEFVNDIEYRCGATNAYKYGFIDTPFNILTNKLTAVLGRDEPKDVFDIWSLARNYSFNWLMIFEETRNKAVVNEIDIEQRIRSFPVELLAEKDWHVRLVDSDAIRIDLLKIANDFLLGSDNSLGLKKPAIETAQVIY